MLRLEREAPGKGSTFPDGITLEDLRQLVEENGFDPQADSFCSNDVEPD